MFFGHKPAFRTTYKKLAKKRIRINSPENACNVFAENLYRPWASATGGSSVAETIFGQGEQNRERQSRERELERFLSRKEAFSKKRSSPD